MSSALQVTPRCVDSQSCAATSCPTTRSSGRRRGRRCRELRGRFWTIRECRSGVAVRRGCRPRDALLIAGDGASMRRAPRRRLRRHDEMQLRGAEEHGPILGRRCLGGRGSTVHARGRRSAHAARCGRFHRSFRTGADTGPPAVPTSCDPPSTAKSGPVSGPRRYDSGQRDCIRSGASSWTLRIRNTRCVSPSSANRASHDCRLCPGSARSVEHALLSRSVCNRPMNSARVAEALVIEVDGILRREHAVDTERAPASAASASAA